MDISGNYIPFNRNFQRWDIQTRRIRLISDIMEDYQENMRRAFRLIGCELGISNHIFPSQQNSTSLRTDDWLDRVSQITTDMYSPAEDIQDPPYSFNRSPPSIPLTRPNLRRGVVYTQFVNPRDNPDTGITNEQIASTTQILQYDQSMNETRCPITWNPFEFGQNVLRINNCGHIFEQPALIEWFQGHSRCPVCRTSVLQSDTNATRTSTSQPSGINLHANARMNISQSTHSSGENNTTSHESTAINQILAGILTSMNGAVNTDTGYYESEFSFNVDDMLNTYTQLVGSQP